VFCISVSGHVWQLPYRRVGGANFSSKKKVSGMGSGIRWDMVVGREFAGFRDYLSVGEKRLWGLAL